MIRAVGKNSRNRNFGARGLLSAILMISGVVMMHGPAVGGEPAAESKGKRKRGAAAADEARPAPAPAPAPEEEPKPEETTTSGDYLRMLSSIEKEHFEEREMFVYKCKHIRGQTLKRILDNFITSRGSVAESDEADLVVVHDSKSNVKTLKEIAGRVDQPVPQILVEARVVELTIDKDFEKEVTLAYERLPETERTFVREVTSSIATPAPNPLTSQGIAATLAPYFKQWGEGANTRSLELFIRYLQSRGRARILSSPNLVLRRGSEGSIITGEEQPILTQTVVSGTISTSTVFKSVGIKLKVTPVMISGDTVRLEVAPEVSTVTGYSTAGSTGISNPIIAVRNANTELEVKDGELISIGGLYRTEEREKRRKVPILGSMPVVGHLFRGTWTQSIRTQLVIFLSITILDEGKPGGVRVHQPDTIPEPVRKEMERIEETMQTPYANVHEDLQKFSEEGK
jgi:general secretion pathway protein D